MNRVFQNTKKLNIRVIWVLLAFALAACVIFASACASVEERREYDPNTEFPSDFVGFIEGRQVYVTSIGQSVEMLQLVLNMDALPDLSYTENSVLKADEVERGAVVFMVVGCSIKSLTESGITKEAEYERAQDFVAAANSGAFDIVCWHIGGVARRGSTSDSFIEYLFGNCSLALFKAEGNSDLKLSDWAGNAGVPYCQFENNMVSILRMLMGADNV